MGLGGVAHKNSLARIRTEVFPIMSQELWATELLGRVRKGSIPSVNRIDTIFANLRAGNRKALMPRGALTGEANQLVLPGIDAANISYNLLKTAAGGGITLKGGSDATAAGDVEPSERAGLVPDTRAA